MGRKSERSKNKICVCDIRISAKGRFNAVKVLNTTKKKGFQWSYNNPNFFSLRHTSSAVQSRIFDRKGSRLSWGGKIRLTFPPSDDWLGKTRVGFSQVAVSFSSNMTEHFFFPALRSSRYPASERSYTVEINVRNKDIARHKSAPEEDLIYFPSDMKCEDSFGPFPKFLGFFGGERENRFIKKRTLRTWGLFVVFAIWTDLVPQEIVFQCFPLLLLSLSLFLPLSDIHANEKRARGRRRKGKLTNERTKRQMANIFIVNGKIH